MTRFVVESHFLGWYWSSPPFTNTVLHEKMDLPRDALQPSRRSRCWAPGTWWACGFSVQRFVFRGGFKLGKNPGSELMLELMLELRFKLRVQTKILLSWSFSSDSHLSVVPVGQIQSHSMQSLVTGIDSKPVDLFGWRKCQMHPKRRNSNEVTCSDFVFVCVRVPRRWPTATYLTCASSLIDPDM